MTTSKSKEDKQAKRHKQQKVQRIARGSLEPVQNVQKRVKPTIPEEERNLLVSLFSSRWMPVKELHRVEAESGVKYKRGKFSNAEAQAVNDIVQKYLAEHNLSFAEFKELFFQRRGHNRLHDFFLMAAQQLVGRPVIHVYHYMRRQYHPGNWHGRWSPEEDAQLKRLFAIHGPKWETIGEQLGRFHVSCKDRYRNIRQSFNTGRWSEDEVERLRAGILAWRREQPRDTAVWAWIAEKVGTRSWMQCLSKYTLSLESHMRRNPNGDITIKPLQWTDQEDLTLIHKIYDLVVEDESEIVWSRLLDDDWNLWSPSCLSRRWALLRKRVNRERYLDMDTILETLMRSIKPLSPDRVPTEDAEMVIDNPDLIVA